MVEATFRSKCAVCGEWIEEGDEIVEDDDGNWIHCGCEETKDGWVGLSA